MRYSVIPNRICGTWWLNKTIQLNVKDEALIQSKIFHYLIAKTSFNDHALARTFIMLCLVIGKYVQLWKCHCLLHSSFSAEICCVSLEVSSSTGIDEIYERIVNTSDVNDTKASILVVNMYFLFEVFYYCYFVGLF